MAVALRKWRASSKPPAGCGVAPRGRSRRGGGGGGHVVVEVGAADDEGDPAAVVAPRGEDAGDHRRTVQRERERRRCLPGQRDGRRRGGALPFAHVPAVRRRERAIGGRAEGAPEGETGRKARGRALGLPRQAAPIRGIVEREPKRNVAAADDVRRRPPTAARRAARHHTLERGNGVGRQVAARRRRRRPRRSGTRRGARRSRRSQHRSPIRACRPPSARRRA